VTRQSTGPPAAHEQEEALEPGVPIVDAHHHLWDNPGDRYLLEELRADTGTGHAVARTVFVECTYGYRPDGPAPLRPVGETERVARLAVESEDAPGPVIAGIVGFADLRLGAAVEEVLAAHVEVGGGRFRGVRHASAWDASPEVGNAHTAPPPGLLAEPGFRAGVAALGRAGLSFDAWLYSPQLGELVELAREHPEVPIVLDHLGGPLAIGPYASRREEVLAAWRTALREVAACPNVTLKLGGIGMPTIGPDWRAAPAPPTSEDVAAEWGPSIRFAIEAFGADRCMFESNFPVDGWAIGYVVLWNAFKRITAGASDGERDDLFRGTATRVYRLDPPPDEHAPGGR
jgi:predicted TIM-barrel fold metal-dependent hydrolase